MTPPPDGVRTFDELARSRRRWLMLVLPLVVVATVAAIVVLDTVVFKTEGPEDRSRFGLAVIVALIAVTAPLSAGAASIARRRASRLTADVASAAREGGTDVQGLIARAEETLLDLFAALGQPGGDLRTVSSADGDLDRTTLEHALVGSVRPSEDAVLDSRDLRIVWTRAQAAQLGAANDERAWFIVEHRWHGARRWLVPSTGEALEVRDDRFHRQARVLLIRDSDGAFRPARVSHVRS